MYSGSSEFSVVVVDPIVVVAKSVDDVVLCNVVEVSEESVVVCSVSDVAVD
ncbi:MAG: hypothetical protein ACYDIA_04000 [Candidatus Humimicrobiaceae bacterium]